jgi:hypothetical protein
MHLYGIKYRLSQKREAIINIMSKHKEPAEVLTLTALVAPVSMTSFPTFRADELHSLEREACFHVKSDEIPEDIRCSCLEGGRFCLIAAHWVVEYDDSSPLWLDENGLPRVGSLIRYTGVKKGGRSVVIGKTSERICCVENA